MKFPDRAEKTEASQGSSEETRELAEALSLFGSAVRHAADRLAARMPLAPPMRRQQERARLRLALAPALALAAAVAVAVPAYTHFHDGNTAGSSRPPAVQQQEANTEARASVNDTVLMNQIDSDLSQDVPDALQPLAELSEQATTKSTTTEKKNATQE